MRAGRPTTGQLIAGGAGLVLFVLSFVDAWGTYEVGAGDFELALSFSLWDGYGLLPKVGALFGLIVAGLVVADALGVELRLPPQTLFGFGAGATLFMLVALAAGPAGEPTGEITLDVSFALARGVLVYLGVLLAAAMAAGGWLHLTEQLRAHRGPVA